MAEEHAYQTVIDAVNLCLPDPAFNLPDPALRDYTAAVIERLVMLGFTPSSADAAEIAFGMHRAESHILNETARTSIPDDLRYTAIDMMAGEFLTMRYQTGRLTLSGLDFSGFLKSVAEGDTSVSFSEAGSDDAKFLALISRMTSGEGSDLICYRQLRW